MFLFGLLVTGHPVAQVGDQSSTTLLCEIGFGFLLRDLFCKTCWVQFNFLLLSPERQNRNPQLKTHSFVAPPWLAALLISWWFFLSIRFVGLKIGTLCCVAMDTFFNSSPVCYFAKEVSCSVLKEDDDVRICHQGFERRVVSQELKLWLSLEKQEITIEKAMLNKRKCITTGKGLQLFVSGDSGLFIFGAFVCSLQSCLLTPYDSSGLLRFKKKRKKKEVFLEESPTIPNKNPKLLFNKIYGYNAFDTCSKEGATTLMELLWHDGDYLTTSANLATQPLKYKALRMRGTK